MSGYLNDPVFDWGPKKAVGRFKVTRFLSAYTSVSRTKDYRRFYIIAGLWRSAEGLCFTWRSREVTLQLLEDPTQLYLVAGFSGNSTINRARFSSS